MELVLCHKSPEDKDTILQHSILPVNPHKWVDGPFRSMVNGKLALLYYKARAQPGERPPNIDANGDYLLEVVDLDEILEVLCRQHNLSYPLRGDPWGARPYRTIAVADTGNNRIALFQYACKRFALWRANYRYAQEVKASNGIVLKEPGSVSFSRDGDLVVGDVKDDVDWTEAVGGDVRAAIEQRKKIPG